jgi:uncharacterized protein YkwD
MRIFVFSSLLLLAGGLFAFNWYLGAFWQVLPSFPERQPQPEQQANNPEESGLEQQASFEATIEEVEQEVSVSTPLRVPQHASPATLTTAGVFVWTNIHRSNEGAASLAASASLNAIAQTKLQDMFSRQYFAHNAPTGEGIAEVAEASGYEYISIGENLALGSYENDQALVQAWMDSPGHRANILNSKFQEIGIAVGQGLFEGQTTWLAVQVFGKPLASCPSPEESLQQEIEFNQIQIQELGTILAQKKQDLDNTHPKFGPSYQQKVDNYNVLVAQYNALVKQTQDLIAAYNTQVRAFNDCAKQ